MLSLFLPVRRVCHACHLGITDELNKDLEAGRPQLRQEFYRHHEEKTCVEQYQRTSQEGL